MGVADSHEDLDVFHIGHWLSLFLNALVDAVFEQIRSASSEIEGVGLREHRREISDNKCFRNFGLSVFSEQLTSL